MGTELNVAANAKVVEIADVLAGVTTVVAVTGSTRSVMRGPAGSE